MQTKTWCVAAFLALSIFQNLAFTSASAKTPSYFTAAVFEFVQTQKCTSDPAQAQKVQQFNLDVYIPVAKLAKSKGADILVFPEYALFPECNRTQTTLFCELVPDPEEKANPCVEAERFSGSPTLRTLSCMARNNSMVIQGNMGEYLPCKGEPGCNPSGHLQFNANVVFDRDGTVIARYRKEHLWNEPHFDLPRRKQYSKFTVDFGTFLSYVCFDIFLERIVQEEMDNDVDGIVFSTMWENTMPLGMTVQFFQSFAIEMNTTLLAACIQLPGQWALGSGVFSGPYGALAYTFDPDGLNKLVVARVPRRNQVLEDPKSSITAVFFNGTTSDWESDGEYVGKEGSDIILPPAPSDRYDNRYHVINMENYTLHQITEPRASIKECSNGMCCSLDYSADSITQTFYFAVFNGTQDTFYPYFWGEEDCLLVRCDAAHGRECATFPLWSNDVFHHVNITANFSTPFVYPAVVNDHFRLVPYSEWNYNTEYTTRGHQANINFDSKNGQTLLVAGLKGRLYREDPATSFY
ncbi:Biotinidase [Araneus ventricosus]|uniref:Biotinidase n=1 Tax=Araneus ventricosus TaxID=182803 RepID=A0A4Y2PVK2_ARAVE|nr:Biotinidase [Araneus ventricosus]